MSDFKVLSKEPLNSEPPLATLAASLVTPPSRVFHRNHGPIPSKNPESYSLSIKSELAGVDLDETLSYQDLEDFERVDVMCALACAGNRRSEMNEEKDVEGLLWGGR
jgi:sulfite oxidase